MILRLQLHHAAYYVPDLASPQAHVTDHAWTWEELIDLIDRDERERKRLAGG